MLIERIEPPSIDDALASFAPLPYVILFDSAKLGATGQWSFLSADPVAVIQRDRVVDQGDDWSCQFRCWQQSTESTNEIPFAGGIAGILSYDLGHAYERLTRPRFDEFQLPALCVGVYDWCIAWNHQTDECFIVSTGVTADQSVEKSSAERRLNEVRDRLKHSPIKPTACSQTALQIESAQHAVPAFADVTSNFTPESYLEAVEQIREHIAAGDIFQANLAQRLLAPLTTHPIELYRRLRRVNAAPLAGYFDAGNWQILSASPERFLEVTHDGQIEARPIKGTRRRRPGVEADLYTRDELRESDKDVAENIMIVDLLRNDLSRVCDPLTLRVPQLCEIETYETVQHLVSSVQATLNPDRDVWDLITASFPGGSITGCPKIRAMDVITSIEQVARGPYCGSMFYQSFGGRFDANILIRTLITSGGWVQMPVGGGITYASDPAAEYQETIDKAVALVRALDSAN